MGSTDFMTVFHFSLLNQDLWIKWLIGMSGEYSHEGSFTAHLLYIAVRVSRHFCLSCLVIKGLLVLSRDMK